jgi:2'-5' RNA ligase
MRLFTAIDLPTATASRLEELVAQLRPAAALRWSRVENLHITTKFVGEWPPERLGEMVAALGAIPSVGSVEIALRGLGYFPNAQQPRVFWVGVEAGEPLARLAKLTERTGRFTRTSLWRASTRTATLRARSARCAARWHRWPRPTAARSRRGSGTCT